jgi:DNA-binding response OmpR family regulator
VARVLLVDDDLDSLRIRKQIFELRGHEVLTASTLDLARGHLEIANAILDLRIPTLEDGLTLIRELRAASPHANIIVLAGNPSDLDDRPERLLVDRILAKPVRSEVLLAATREP